MKGPLPTWKPSKTSNRLPQWTAPRGLRSQHQVSNSPNIFKQSLQNWWKDVKRCEKMWKEFQWALLFDFETVFQLTCYWCFVGECSILHWFTVQICACQLNISSPTGPAEQFAGGSLPKSLGSFFWAPELPMATGTDHKTMIQPEEKGLKMTWPPVGLGKKGYPTISLGTFNIIQLARLGTYPKEMKHVKHVDETWWNMMKPPLNSRKHHDKPMDLGIPY